MTNDTPILPQSTLILLGNVQDKRHPGLQLDKLSKAGDMKNQKEELQKVTDTQGDNQLLEKLRNRRRDTLDLLSARQLSMTTCGALTLHLSRAGALDNAGIALHPLYGFVYLPGSGIKGLVRAYAETTWAPSQPDREKAWRQIEQAFGWSPNSERHKKGWRPKEIEPQAGAAVGRLVFHDAWPQSWPKPIVDVVNNHHKNYYAGKDDPGDWENPDLIYFLAIGAGVQFEFAISDRKPAANDNLLETACDWLREALTIEGAGAKTAAGYGRFKSDTGEQAPIPKTLIRKKYELQLVSPAFLAGANQKKEDCDLRPATLRGLLRWWWRTMHTAHLDRKTLKQLETAVWGDAESGSPVRIAVDLVKEEKPVQYNHRDPKKKSQPESDFKCQNGLVLPTKRKTTQGLFYASYGMDAGDKSRWYRPAGTNWSVRIDARSGRFSRTQGNQTKKIEIKPADILGQAEAALWLLCRFGGVGSRGRKGFGSFADIEVEGITDVEGCKSQAQKLRQICLDERTATNNEPCSSALEKMIFYEIETPWSNPWKALDQLGYVIQDFAQKYAHNDCKKTLGLPRKIDQNGRTIALAVGKIRRHAAPIHYHLAKRIDEANDGQLLIRATAFPSHKLPNYQESKRMLDELRVFLAKEFPQKIRSDLPQPNTRVQAIILPETTRRGGHKAKHEATGLSGHIQDSQNEPENIESGQCVELIVVSVTESKREMVFKWAPPSTQSGRSNPRRRRPRKHH